MGQLAKGWPVPDAVQTRYRVKGMDCGSCAAKVDTTVRRLPGVEDVSVSATAGTMTVRHAPDLTFPALKAALKALGYDVWLADRTPDRLHDRTRQDREHNQDEATSLHSDVHDCR
jgi:Zn2+/Cd2+-exporting ATPase